MIFAKADDFQNMAQPLEDFARKFKSKVFLMLSLKDQIFFSSLASLLTFIVIFLAAYVYIY